MGESPQEEASNKFQNMVQSMIQSRGQFGTGAALNQMSNISPIFDRGRSDLNSGIDKSINNLNLGLSTRMSGIGQQIGEGLISGGVPAGQGRGTAFASAMAPAIAGTQEAAAGLNQTRALTLADFAKTEGLTLADLLKSSDQIITQLLGQQMQGIKGMKDSTGLGDTFAVLQSIGKIVGSVFGVPSGGGVASGGGAITGGGLSSSHPEWGQS